MIDNDELYETLRHSIMLVTLHIESVPMRKRDLAASMAATQAANATQGAVTAYKNLLAGADEEYKALNLAVHKARMFYYKNTVPYGDIKSVRIIPSARLMDFLAEFGEFATEIRNKRSDFIKVYADCVKVAEKNLGKLAHSYEYPTVAEIMRKFEPKLDFNTAPDMAVVGMLPKELSSLITAKVSDNMKQKEQIVRRELLSRAKEVIDGMVERLDPSLVDGKPRVFRDTLITNAHAACTALKNLNVFNDDAVAHVASMMEAKINPVTPQQLRANTNLRSSVWESAKEIQRFIGGLDNE